MEKMNGESMNIERENIKRLKEIFPEVFTEDKIDFEKLQLILGEDIEESEERYSFNWNGKRDAITLSQTPTTGTLRPNKDNSKNWDETENLYIEGDNLEVLKLLQKSYHGKIKMIYIDPPYNTGKDFVYKDNYRDNMKNYLEFTEQVDEEGRKLSTNTEKNGRYHTDWLNMMYPRLRLARNLLTDDGVIFISIDDNEVHNLRKICDEVFGEDNFVGEIIRKTKSMVGDDGNGLNTQHENLLLYSKHKEKTMFVGSEKDFKGYSNSDNDINGDWCSADPSAKSGGATTYFEIKNPYTDKIDLPPNGRYWAFNRQTMNEYIKSGRIKFKKEHGDNERGFIFKRYKKNLSTMHDPLSSIFAIDNKYMNQNGKRDLQELGIDTIFDYPKPKEYIKMIIYSLNDKGSIILDFFSGSSTTAHAVMDLNAEDGGNRKFITVQLPEPTDEKSEAYKAGYKTIADIGRERIRRAGGKILEDNKDKKGIENLDIGFKAFTLDSSNIKEWNPEYMEKDFTMEELVNNFVPNRSEEDILYEIILKYGIDLAAPIEEHEVNGKIIYNIGLGTLYICLDNDIDNDVVEEILKLNEEYKMPNPMVVFKDTGFKNDEIKLNAKLSLNDNGIGEVVSI